MPTESLYYKTVRKELAAWEKRMLKNPGITNRASKALQSKVHKLVPQRAQDLVTASVRTLVKSIISGSGMIDRSEPDDRPALAESDYLAERAFAAYHKTAVAQGIGFGLGGVLINLADLPALMSVKVKFLFDCAKLYGYDVRDESERLFMLYVFQLAFCGDARRLEIFPIIKQWDDHAAEMPLDWEKLQIEYRDYMDIAKLLQLLPVVGSVAGGTANHNLMKKLQATAMNCYRLRYMARMEK
ncbi:MAG: EcsC family protein [Defluviitaleaceae bacterium]|nr:EcsC family protein [Defluviitaleaceae bacterium]